MFSELKLHHVNAEQLLHVYIERRLNLALNRFGDRLDRVTVRIKGSGRSKNDPMVCRITGDLRSFGLVAAEASDSDVYTAIDRCAARFARRCTSRFARQRSRRPARISIRDPWSLPIAS